MGPLLQQWAGRTKNNFPCSLQPQGAASLFLIWGEGQGRSRSLLGGMAGVFCHPFDGVECRGHAQYPGFAPNTLFLLPALQKWRLDFFGLFGSCVHKLPQRYTNGACTQLFLVPYSLFAFCGSRRCLARCKRCSKWSRSQPVPDGLRTRGRGKRQMTQRAVAANI